MRKFSALLLFGAIAAVVLSGCNAAESGVPTDSEATEASTEMAADVPESVEKAFAETANASDDIIFIGENKIENFVDYADKNYAVDVDTAFENIINSEIVPKNSKLMCSGAALFKNDTYYVIEKIFDNGDAAVTEEIFWVNAENGSVYVFLDPTLPVSNNLKEFKNEIDEDDGRSRLIKIFDGNAENSAAKVDPNDFIPLTEPVGTSGLEVTVEELLPIAQTARNDMYLMECGGKIFNYKDGHYLGYSGDDFYAFLNSLYDIFAEETNIAEAYISSLKCYDGGDNELLLSTGEMVYFKEIDEDIFNLKGSYDRITIDGGAGSNPTYLYNEFEITNRTETTLTLKNTAYYNEENDEPIQVFEYDMVLEDGTWKFLNFECWY